MNKRGLLICLCLLLAVDVAAFWSVACPKGDTEQDAVAVNEVLWTVQDGWAEGGAGADGSRADAAGIFADTCGETAGLDYVVLDLGGEVLFRTGTGLSESIHEAVCHRDTILDIRVDDEVVGKLIVNNDTGDDLREGRSREMALLAVSLFVSCAVCAGFFFYLERRVIQPFRRLERFAERVAGGNLEVPLDMDRANLFGAFTEAFDLMRSELKAARLAEAKANQEKKELIAKLSHDIRTPVASIKAAAEVGAALTVPEMLCKDGAGDGEGGGGRSSDGAGKCGDECPSWGALDRQRIGEIYVQIIRKADQINALVTNLFTAALEELRRLSVTPTDMESRELSDILENADYLRRARIGDIPACLIRADRLRLQQVFDNLFSNSYKYAGTGIVVEIRPEPEFLAVAVEDFGEGVGEEELPLLKEKFQRGKYVGEVPGAGLGLYLSDYFMKEMGGELEVTNGERGFKVSVRLRMCGRE